MENEISKALGIAEKKVDYINLIDSNFQKFTKQFGFSIPSEILIKESTKYFNDHNYEPDPKGLLRAREAISKFYSEQEIKTDPNDLVITASTSESYSLIFNNFAEPGDEILLPNPTYPLFEYLADFSHLKPVFYQLDENDNWKVNLKNIESKINSKTKGIVLISPNNPCGSVISNSEIEEVLKISKKYKLFLVFDEVFSEFQSNYLLPRPLLTEGVDIFLLNGISKLLALPDLKLAWIKVISKNPEDVIEKLETANDTYLNANYLSQYMLPVIIKWSAKIRNDINFVLTQNKNILRELLKNAGPNFKCNVGQGGIHTIISVKTENEEEDIVLGLLNKHNLSVHPGYFYDLETKDGYKNFVISFLNKPNSFKSGIQKFIASFV